MTIVPEISIKDIVQFGFAGVALFMFFYLNISWQREYIKLGEKFNETLNNMGQRFTKSLEELRDTLKHERR